MSSIHPPLESPLRALWETPLRALNVPSVNPLPNSVEIGWAQCNFGAVSNIAKPGVTAGFWPIGQGGFGPPPQTIVANAPLAKLWGGTTKGGANINTQYGIPLNVGPAVSQFAYGVLGTIDYLGLGPDPSLLDPEFTILYNNAAPHETVTLTMMTAADQSDANGSFFAVDGLTGINTLLTTFDWRTGFGGGPSRSATIPLPRSSRLKLFIQDVNFSNLPAPPPHPGGPGVNFMSVTFD